MKVWITRHCAGSIRVGGLERLDVHFREPKWLIEPFTEKTRALPWGRHHETHGDYKYFGWYSHNLPKLSVGKWIGYCDDDNPEKEIALFIWNKLCEHFFNAPFAEWEEIEKQGRAKEEDFLLEIDLKITINT